MYSDSWPVSIATARKTSEDHIVFFLIRLPRLTLWAYSHFHFVRLYEPVNFIPEIVKSPPAPNRSGQKYLLPSWTVTSSHIWSCHCVAMASGSSDKNPVRFNPIAAINPIAATFRTSMARYNPARLMRSRGTTGALVLDAAVRPGQVVLHMWFWGPSSLTWHWFVCRNLTDLYC